MRAEFLEQKASKKKKKLAASLLRNIFLSSSKAQELRICQGDYRADELFTGLRREISGKFYY